jgi:curved DNA-binding protein CbpA
MNHTLDYYSILGCERNASALQIKTRFRILAKKLHPDTAGDTEENRMNFLLVRNAWNTLSDPDKRKVYDSLLESSRSMKQREGERSFLAGKEGFVYKANDQIYSFLNFIFWEIEDFLTSSSQAELNATPENKTRRHYIICILVFFDKWLLTPAGFPDYFMSARKLENTDPEEWILRLGGAGPKTGYQAYLGVKDFFYSLRKRMDRFLEKFQVHHLSSEVGADGLMLIDCIIECQNFALYYLSYILDENNTYDNIPPFAYSRDLFRMRFV